MTISPHLRRRSTLPLARQSFHFGQKNKGLQEIEVLLIFAFVGHLRDSRDINQKNHKIVK